MGKNLEKLSDDELLALATAEFIQLVLKFKNGDEHAFERAKYTDELARRNMKLGITRDFIHRIFVGEFDNADGVEINIKEVKGK